MKAAERVRVAGTGRWLPAREAGESAIPRLPVDLSRLRRMDRYARSGFFAGSLSLVEAGVIPRRSPDATFGVVFGTAHGCRDSMVDFTMEILAAQSVEQLSPALFAETVHNTVNGELAIAWGLGGPSETITSGRTGGADAIARGGELVRTGRASAVVAGGAEGIHPKMVEWWGRGGRPGEEGLDPDSPRDAGAALVLVPEAEEPGAGGVLLAGSTRFFEPDPDEAARRAASWILSAFEGREPPLLLIASPDPASAFPAWRCRHVASELGELYGAAGAVGAVLAVEELRSGRAAGAVVISRDPAGPATLLAFVTPRRG
jgi:3-oxoacyl-(acyl-carrier-protein) synthase